jgi:hypothetical protein
VVEAAAGSEDSGSEKRMMTATRHWISTFACLGTAALLGAGCFGPGNMTPSDLTARERAVRVYQGGQQPDCKYTQLGTVEATSGTALEMGTYASSIAKMQRQAAEMGGTGVIVLDHSKNQMADQTTGMAIRCQ